LPEIGLGLGRSQQVVGGIDQEILTWYNEDGIAYETPETAMQCHLLINNFIQRLNHRPPDPLTLKIGTEQLTPTDQDLPKVQCSCPALDICRDILLTGLQFSAIKPTKAARSPYQGLIVAGKV
jgi:hypothetical protein